MIMCLPKLAEDNIEASCITILSLYILGPFRSAYLCSAYTTVQCESLTGLKCCLKSMLSAAFDARQTHV